MLSSPMRFTRRSIAATIAAWGVVCGLLFAAVGVLLPHEPVPYDTMVSSIAVQSGSSLSVDGETAPGSVDNDIACACLLCRDCGPCAHQALILPLALQAALSTGLQQPGDDAATPGSTVAGPAKPPRA